MEKSERRRQESNERPHDAPATVPVDATPRTEWCSEGEPRRSDGEHRMPPRDPTDMTLRIF